MSNTIVLMFGDQGKHQSAINRFSNLISSGTNIDVAFTEAIGHVEDLESGFSAYINSSIYSYRRANLDASVSKERIQSRALSPADVAAGRDALHVAMGRQTEARASIDEARKLDPNNADSFVAEGLLFDKNGERDQARTWAVLLASRPQQPDLPKATQLLTRSCDGGLAQACELLKSLPK